MAEHYGTLLRDLAEAIGVDAKALLDTQELVVDGLTIGFMLDGNTRTGAWTFFTPIPTPRVNPASPLPAIYLLQANARYEETGGFTLSLEPETDALVLAGSEPIALLDGTTAAAALKAFVDYANYWQSWLSGADVVDDRDPEPPPRPAEIASDTSLAGMRSYGV